MEILDKLKKAFIIINLFLMLIGCNLNAQKSIVKSDKNEKNTMINSFEKENIKFYKRINLINLEGIEQINTKNISSLDNIVGLKKEKNKVSIYTFSPNKNVTYYLETDFYKTVELLYEDDVKTFFRNIKIIKIGEYIIDFEYVIFENKEHLHSITFTYENGKLSRYVNENQNFVEYNINLNESNIPFGFIKE
jgi:hypothetical protein